MTALRVLTGAALLCLGVATGVAAVAVHQWWWGLILAVAASLAVLVALPPALWGRLPYAVGWLAVVGLLSVPRPEGDYLVPGNLVGYTLLSSGLVIIVVALVTLPTGRRMHGTDPPAP